LRVCKYFDFLFSPFLSSGFYFSCSFYIKCIFLSPSLSIERGQATLLEQKKKKKKKNLDLSVIQHFLLYCHPVLLSPQRLRSQDATIQSAASP
jgi:hypothetical protein